MKAIIISCVTAMGLALGGSLVAFASQRAEHTVSWYVSHPAYRENVLKKCSDDHSLDGNGDCRNATAAAARATTSSSNTDTDSTYSVSNLKANGTVRGMVLGLCKSNRPPPASVCRNARQAQDGLQ